MTVQAETIEDAALYVTIPLLREKTINKLRCNASKQHQPTSF